jgi:predicted ATPase with chaperone activity
MRATIQILAVIAFCVISLPSVEAANAQSQVSPRPEQATPSAEISDQKLDAVANAMQRMSTVKQAYQKKIDAASPEDKQRLMSEGNDALQKALSDQGLSVDEYNTIITVARNDPTIRAKLLQRLHEPDQSE